MSSISVAVLEKMSAYHPSSIFRYNDRVTERVKKVVLDRNFFGKVSKRKKLDLRIKLNVLSSHVVKIENKNLSDAGAP